MKMYDETYILVKLLGFIHECGSQKEAAKQLNISQQYLSDIISRRREISNHIANLLGFNKVSYFVSLNKNADQK